MQKEISESYNRLLKSVSNKIFLKLLRNNGIVLPKLPNDPRVLFKYYGKDFMQIPDDIYKAIEYLNKLEMRLSYPDLLKKTKMCRLFRKIKNHEDK